MTKYEHTFLLFLLYSWTVCVFWGNYPTFPPETQPVSMAFQSMHNRWPGKGQTSTHVLHHFLQETPPCHHTPNMCVYTCTHVLRGLCCCLCWMHTHTTCMHTHSMLGGYAAACVRMISHNHIVEPYHVHPIGCIQMNVTLHVAMVQQLCPTCTHPQCIGGRLAIRGSSLMMCKVVYTYTYV